MKRQKTPRTNRHYSRQDGCILVQDVPIGADSTQPGLPRPALHGEITHLRAMLRDRIKAGQRAQRKLEELFPQEDAAGTQGVQSKFTVGSPLMDSLALLDQDTIDKIAAILAEAEQGRAGRGTSDS